MVGFAILIWCHAYYLVAFHLGQERTANATVGAGGDNGVIGLAVIDDALFHKRRGRTGLYASTAGYAFGIEEILADTGGDPGVKTAPFVVLVSAEMPAILAEVSCLSNRQEVELLTRPLYREHIAQALARGIRRYADDVNQTGNKEAGG